MKITENLVADSEPCKTPFLAEFFIIILVIIANLIWKEGSREGEGFQIFAFYTICEYLASVQLFVIYFSFLPRVAGCMKLAQNLARACS